MDPDTPILPPCEETRHDDAPRRGAITDADLIARRPAFHAGFCADIEEMVAGSYRRLRSEYAAHTARGEQFVFDSLSLSGGGALGAFGAGFLEGWGEVQEEGFARPRFDVVNGISTGSLIAPFALVGTDEAYGKIAHLYEHPGDDWVCRNGLFPFLPFHASLMRNPGLRNTIRGCITPELIEALAEAHGEDRQLRIGATSVDYGTLRLWDVARITAEMEMREAAKRMEAILMASSAMPGAFPPIVIDDLLYVDGSAAINIVGFLDNRQWIFEDEPERLGFLDAARPLKVRSWMVLNNKILPEPVAVKAHWPSIAQRSLASLLRTSTRQTMVDAQTVVHAINRLPQVEAEFRFVCIPQDFEIPKGDRLFDAKVMRQLVELGRAMGVDPSAWRTEVPTPGAPLEYY